MAIALRNELIIKALPLLVACEFPTLAAEGCGLVAILWQRPFNGSMEFRILGPLEVVEEGRVVLLGSSRRRALLALFLLNAGEIVSRDRLIEELWHGDPPPAAE